MALQVSSTADDQFIHFNMKVEQISLTNQAGKTTTIFSAPTDVDFMPSNGSSAPFATVSVPQDVYTSAAITLSDVRFSRVTTDSLGRIYFGTYAYGYLPVPPTVVLAKPITVSGPTMGLTLDLQAAQSASVTGAPPDPTSYTIHPAFNLRSFAIPAQGATPLTGKCVGIGAQVKAVDLSASAMTVVVAGHPKVSGQNIKFAFNSETEFLGIAAASSLSPGALVNIDLTLRPDATYLATRIEVRDAVATNVTSGQLVEVVPSANYISSTATEQQGAILSDEPVGMGYPYVHSGTTTFQTSARFPNLGAVPFAANFSSATLVAGQQVSVASTSISFSGGTRTVPTSITLVPQTINGAVYAASSAGNYRVYSVQLAASDPIVQLNNPALPATYARVQNPSLVEVYVEPSAAQLNSRQLAAGGPFRFSGLLFNDGGVLRMVCDQVADGVAQ